MEVVDIRELSGCAKRRASPSHAGGKEKGATVASFTRSATQVSRGRGAWAGALERAEARGGRWVQTAAGALAAEGLPLGGEAVGIQPESQRLSWAHFVTSRLLSCPIPLQSVNDKMQMVIGRTCTISS